MSNTIADAETVLAIDVGTTHTRACLFDVVEGRYRFVADANVPSTAFAPAKDIALGMRAALQELQELVGRTLIGADGQLIIPPLGDGSGVDRCVATLSAGAPLKVAAVGLLEDVSLESVQRLIGGTYAQVREVISLNDRRKTAARLDGLLRLRPDMVVIAGGTDGGASQSLMALLEAVGLACYLLPKEQRPDLLYAGNQAQVDQVKADLGSLAPIEIAPNIRPTLENERLLPAQRQLAKVYTRARSRQMNGVQALEVWSGGNVSPTAHAFARAIRYLSKELAPRQRGALGVDLGASATTLAAAFAGEQFLQVHSNLGLGVNLSGLLAGSIAEINRWVDADVTEEYIRDYIYNKALYPASVPGTAEDLSVEYAIACQIIQIALRKARWKPTARLLGEIPGFLPPFETIIAAGSIFSQAPSRGRVLLTLLNALQPVGWASLALDQNGLAPALGAAAETAPLLTVQGLRDANNFQNLGMVIAPVGRAPLGTPVLRVNVQYSDEHKANIEVKAGDLEIIPLPSGQTADLRIQPLHRFDVGMGQAGRGGVVKNVSGSDAGIIIDARGRPLAMPADAGLRRELLARWLNILNS